MYALTLYQVSCFICGAQGPLADTEEKAGEAWNTNKDPKKKDSK
jgi:hypothetical protein